MQRKNTKCMEKRFAAAIFVKPFWFYAHFEI